MVHTDERLEQLLHAATDQPTDSCPINRFLDVFDGPWTTLIVRDLLSGPKRFGELQTSLDTISPKTLSARLKTLASYDILTRHNHGTVPPKVTYELTPKGHSLVSVLAEMADWALEHLPTEAARPPRPRPTPQRLG